MLQALAAPSIREGRLLTWAPESASQPSGPSLCFSLSCFCCPSSKGPLSSKSCWAHRGGQPWACLSGELSPHLPLHTTPDGHRAASDCRATPATPSVASAIAMGTDVDPGSPGSQQGLPLSWPAQLPAGRGPARPLTLALLQTRAKPRTRFFVLTTLQGPSENFQAWVSEGLDSSSTLPTSQLLCLSFLPLDLGVLGFLSENRSITDCARACWEFPEAPCLAVPAAHMPLQPLPPPSRQPAQGALWGLSADSYTWFLQGCVARPLLRPDLTPSVSTSSVVAPPCTAPPCPAYLHTLWTGRPARGPSSKLGPSCCPLKSLPS